MSKLSETPKIDVLLITATDVETTTLHTIFSAYTGMPPRRYFYREVTTYDLGRIGGARVFHVRCEAGSMGPNGSTLTVSDCLERLDVRNAILVGIAFGVDKTTQKLGEILVSNQLAPYELQRVGTQTDGKKIVIRRFPGPEASSVLMDRLRDAKLDWLGAEVRFGTLLSGEKLVDNVDYRDDLTSLAPEAIGGEMEASGLYAASHRRGAQWIVVKAICDWADGKKRTKKKQRQAVAARNAVEFVLHALTRGGLTNLNRSRFGRTRSSSELHLPVLKIFNSHNPKTSAQIVLSLNAGDFYLTFRITQKLLLSALRVGNTNEAADHYASAMNILRSQGKLRQAGKLFLEAWALSSQIGPLQRLKLLKEALAIAHEADDIQLASAVVSEIRGIDRTGTLSPAGDLWLPGVIMWRSAFVNFMQSSAELTSSVAMCRDATQWFEGIDDPNKSGLASAHLNYAWLLYLSKQEISLTHFQRAMTLSHDASPRTYGEALIGFGMAEKAFRPKQEEAERNVARGSTIIKNIGAGVRSYKFLGEHEEIISASIKRSKIGGDAHG